MTEGAASCMGELGSCGSEPSGTCSRGGAKIWPRRWGATWAAVQWEFKKSSKMLRIWSSHASTWAHPGVEGAVQLMPGKLGAGARALGSAQGQHALQRHGPRCGCGGSQPTPCAVTVEALRELHDSAEHVLGSPAHLLQCRLQRLELVARAAALWHIQQVGPSGLREQRFWQTL